jgi:hypothetical protein
VSIARIIAEANALWRGQPRWRYTVIGAAVATVGALVMPSAGPTGGGGGSTYPSPAPGGGQGPVIINPTAPVDLTVDARLRQFYQAYTDALPTKAQTDAFCEQLVVALTKLQAEDAATATGARRDAIAEARRCQPLIAGSNQRWHPSTLPTSATTRRARSGRPKRRSRPQRR